MVVSLPERVNNWAAGVPFDRLRASGFEILTQSEAAGAHLVALDKKGLHR